MLKFLRNRRGFTLVEATVTIAVAALLIGVGTQAVQKDSEKCSYGQTRDQINIVNETLESFVRDNGYYPLPAGRSLGSNNRNFGRAVSASSDASVDDVGSGVSEVVYGALPFSTLGLNSSFAGDCWGNKFTYVVTNVLTSATTFEANSGAIRVYSSSSNEMTTAGKRAAYAVISHGQNGLGAVKIGYSGSGHGFCTSASGTIDKENCNLDGDIYIAAFNNGAGSSTYFDDIVAFTAKASFTYQNCNGRTESWNAASNGCTGTTPNLNHNSSITVTDSTTSPQGSVVMTCTNGELSQGSPISCNASCSSPCGTIVHGATCTAYQSAAPAGPCVSEVRTCNNGTLSGTYTNNSCNAGCAAATAVWDAGTTGCTAAHAGLTSGQVLDVTNTASGKTGTARLTCGAGTGTITQSLKVCNAQCSSPCGTLNHSGTCTAYQSATPAGACVSEVRTCTNGTMSGSYTNTSCSAGCTGTPWGAVTHGYSGTAYQASSVACGSTCTSQTRTCTSGTMSGTYTNTSCSVAACATCNLPWGGTTAHGTSVTAYQASSVACGATCTSESRTCTNGALSGSYTNQACTVASCACTLPWGGTIANGANVTAYQSATPSGACVSQTRTCTNTVLSGTYTAQTCTAGCTGTPWGAVANGYSNTAYVSATPAGACTSQTRTCTAGTMSGTYTATSCTAGCASTPWGAVASGYSNTAYQAASVACGSSCVSQTRTCTAGTLSGTYTNTSCSVASCASCSLPWGGSIAHGANATAWNTTASCGGCASQSRSCSNGTLSGTYTAQSCNNSSCASCSSPCGTIAHGATCTAYSATSVACGGSCSTVSQVRTCTNGTLSGSFTNASCSVAACSNPCSLPWGGSIAHGASVTAYAASSVSCGNTCTSQSRSCNNGSLSGSYTNSSCSVAGCAGCGAGSHGWGNCMSSSMPAKAHGWAGQYWNIINGYDGWIDLHCDNGGWYTDQQYCEWVGGGSGGSGGFGGCFIGTAEITLADGSKKTFAELKVGDKVQGQGRINEVRKVHSFYSEALLYRINGGGAYVTSGHPFFTTEGWKSVDPEMTRKEGHNVEVTKLEIGDVLVGENGRKVTLRTLKGENHGTNLVYNPSVDGDNTYYANGLLMHNKCGGDEFCQEP